MKTTWKNDPELKCSVVTNLIRHREADNYQRGSYTEGGGSAFLGCALGCTLIPFDASKAEVAAIDLWVESTFSGDRSWSKAVGSKYGLPVWLARLEEAVFESLGSPGWPTELASAVPVGVPYKELKLRVFDELKRRIEARGVHCYTSVARGDENRWHSGDGEWKNVRVDLLELLRGVEVAMPQPTAEECPAMAVAAA